MTEATVDSVKTYTASTPVRVLQASAPSRMASLDASRAIAALAICWCHTAGNFDIHDKSALLGTFGVPFYLFAAMLFGVRGFARDPDRSVWGYFQNRFVRLYLPFLAWDAFYQLLHSAKQTAGLSAVESEPLTNHLWAGVQEHLYFLPLLMLVTTIMSMLVKPALKTSLFRNSAVGIFVGVAVLLSCLPTPLFMSQMDTASHALWQYWRAAPAALLAIAFALVAARDGSIPRVSIWSGLLGLIILTSCIVWQWTGEPSRTLRIVSGIGFLIFAMAPWQGWIVNKLAVIGRLSMGIYLIHVAVIRTLDIVVHKANVTPDLNVKIGVCLVAFIVSLTTTWLMSRTRFTAWLIGL